MKAPSDVHISKVSEQAFSCAGPQARLAKWQWAYPTSDCQNAVKLQTLALNRGEFYGSGLILACCLRTC